MSAQSQMQPDHASVEAGTASAEPSAALPFYVRDALADLTPAQKKHVMAGYLSGDFTMTMAHTLQRKALFYLHIDSPNGRCGTLRLTPLGMTVQGILKDRAAAKATRS